jgi:SAM-dependent methyltransferase
MTLPLAAKKNSAEDQQITLFKISNWKSRIKNFRFKILDFRFKMTDTLDYYNQNAAEISSRYEQAEVAELWQTFSRFFEAGQKVLEIGCGSGRDAAYMIKLGCDVRAIDGSVELCKKAVELHPELENRVVFHRLPEVLPFADGQFDAVVSVACLMHMQLNEISPVLAEIARVLKSRGLAFISVPIQRDDVDDAEVDCCGRQFTLISVSDWKDKFSSTGFEVIETKINPDGLGRLGVLWANFILKLDKK